MVFLEKVLRLVIICAIVLFLFFTIVMTSCVAAIMLGGAANKDKYNIDDIMKGLPEMITEEMVVASVEAQQEYGAPAALTIAQIILESSGNYPGGLSKLAYECNNLFGMKGEGPAGSKIYQTNEQDKNGGSYKVEAKFRKYNNVRESIFDHAKLLTTGRYEGIAATAHTSDEWAVQIAKAGYATDKSYADKLIALMKKYDLYRFDGLTLENLFDVNVVGDGISNGEFIWPLKVKGRLTSPFGGRVNPVTGKQEGHSGQDIAAPQNSAILAADGGTVIHAGKYGTGGNAVIIDHGGGVQTHYYHMINGGIMVRKGQKVSQGQQIGKVGSTGMSTGNHLHFGIRINGNFVNPMKYVKQPN